MSIDADHPLFSTPVLELSDQAKIDFRARARVIDEMLDKSIAVIAESYHHQQYAIRTREGVFTRPWQTWSPYISFAGTGLHGMRVEWVLEQDEGGALCVETWPG